MDDRDSAASLAALELIGGNIDARFTRWAPTHETDAS